MRRILIHTAEPVMSRSGVIANVIQRNTKAQVPVDRVINSIGLAPKSSE